MTEKANRTLLKVVTKTLKIAVLKTSDTYAKFQILVCLVDQSGKDVGTEKHETDTVYGNQAFVELSQTFLLHVPAAGINTSLILKLVKEKKVIGISKPVSLEELSDEVVSKWFPLEGDYSVLLDFGWYGSKKLEMKTPPWRNKPTRTGNFKDMNRNIMPRALDTNTGESKSIEVGTSGRTDFVSDEVRKLIVTATQDINAELIKVANEKSAIDGKVQKAMQRVAEMEQLLKKYRNVDDDAQQLLATSIDWHWPTVLQKAQEEESIRDSAVVSLSDGDLPSEYSKFLATNTELYHLSTIKRKLVKSDARWLKTFLSNEGLENILALIKHVEAQENPTMPLFMKEAQLASFLKSILNNSVACQYALRECSDTISEFIKIVVSTKNQLMKVQMFHLFSALCIYGKNSHTLIFNSLQHVGNVVGQPFVHLVETLKNEKDRETITATMCLINSLIYGEKQLDNRLKIRSYLTYGDILQIIYDLRKTIPDEKQLILQFDIFEEISRRDEEELTGLRYIGNMDLHNPQSIFNQVLPQVESYGVSNLMIRHLHHLLIIPNACISPEVAWLFIERASHRIISNTELEASGMLTYGELNKQVFKLIKEAEEKEKKEGKSSNWKRAIARNSAMTPLIRPTSVELEDMKETKKKTSCSNSNCTAHQSILHRSRVARSSCS
eukprot:TRINITY_DN7143_c0_g2_i1.p1 TRINITY_DN7143_c0_g2~~TRINITY_DN7143_c0_g2_i1.p1  ORF type:complete len:675 (-),score=160.42 TRINITY_DN7143_c0_g2_i1:1457-3460(-)